MYNMVIQNKKLFDITISIQDIFLEIIRPLNNIGIKNFSYYKIYKNNKGFYICSHHSWHKKHYYDKEGFLGLIRTINECKKNKIDKVIFADGYDEVNQKFKSIYGYNKPMNVEKMIDNNLWNSMSFYYAHEEYFEAFNFFGTNDNPNLVRIYTEQTSLLQKFISYFLCRFLPVVSFIPQENWVNIEVENYIGSIVPRQISLKSLDNRNVILTEQQYNLLFHIAKGDPIKTAAYNLNISQNTAQNYLNRMKVKLCCSSTEEIIKLWISSSI